MYSPAQFNETDPERIAALLSDYPFGMLITTADGEPLVSHLPMHFEAGVTGSGKLLGHLARANPHCQQLAVNQQVLAVFQGPHAYVSPSWYASPGVPTWNYAVVHIHGKARLIEDESGLEALLVQLTAIHESHLPSPWQPDLSGDRRIKLLSMIVGFEIDITAIQAKFKLSQNRSDEDRQRVIRELSLSEDQTDNAVANLMAGNYKADQDILNHEP